MWQDIALTLANVVFMLSMVSAVRDKQKAPLSTSIPSALALMLVCIVQINLKLYLATVLTFIILCLWATIAIQRFRQGRIEIVKKG